MRAFLVAAGVYVLGFQPAAAQTLPKTMEELEPSRASWLVSKAARSLEVFTPNDMLEKGLHEVLFSPHRMVGGKLNVGFSLRTSASDSAPHRIFFERQAFAYLPLPSGAQFQVWSFSSKKDSLFLGMVRIPAKSRSRQIFRADVQVGTSEQGNTTFISLRPAFPSPPAPRYELTPTSVALAAPPARIPPGSTLEQLRDPKHWEDALKASPSSPTSPTSPTSLTGKVEPESPITRRPPVMIEEEATRFETSGLQATSADPAVRKLWRLIANADTPTRKAEAQQALADYYRSVGDEEKAALSAKRATFWKEVIERERS